ncbi:glycogen synthase [Flavobacterium aquatile]|uniref:Glycosyl transferase family 1 n=1 Tax=Flavobacterium aquatile LMG 4008 = ATCC 11947 TaxID=1453498 RepID=A0A095UXN2_9FLAO|nr:glycogen synthase [Flavobacterium aquatile]KGD67345.1 glycosyl transferase family 1 [Flavobacterium aquatile LMG 4008 = ATCC 11947]OXA66888.1 glycosyl transferase family 1 [Flavobacterium aquatile LMG 4008 = ATCC 11947]GEC78872.1 glycosyl transferase family 1 [Flavobacterium aquatile]
MKIALFSNEFPPNIYGGAGVHIDFLSQELAKLGQVEVRCFGNQLENTNSMNVIGIQSSLNKMKDDKNQHIKMFHNLSRNVEMSQNTLDADVIHCHTWYTHLAGIFSRELLQVPLILTTHSLETHRPWKVEQLGNGYFLSRWIENHAYNTADGIIAVSQQMKSDVIEAYGVAPEKVTVIHNGIDPEFYKPTFDTDLLLEYGINLDIPFVLFVGRITRQKGISQLISAAKYFNKNCQVVLCAGAPDTEEIAKETEKLIQELQSQRDGIILISEMLPREKIKVLYSHARVFACPSLYEPFGIINLEAMSCETPVVGSAVGGIPEIIIEGKTGYLIELESISRTDFNPKNPEEFQKNFAKKINLLLDDENLATQMGKAGRERVLDIFSWESIAKTTYKYYENVISKFEKEKA